MRDIAVLIFLLACIGAALYRAWYGVLALAIFSYMNPHAYAWGFVRSFPAYQTLFFTVVFSTLITKDRQPIPKDWRIPVFILLWLYFIFTTTQAYLPDLAWQKLWFVTKIYLPFFFTLVLINTREKLLALIAAIGVSIGFIAAKGGLFAIATGFSYRVWGPPGTQFEGNNELAIAILMAIPLLILWYRETDNPWIKRGIIAAIPLMFASVVSSWSRGAFLTMGVLALLVIWHSKKKFLVVPIVIVAAIVGAHFLPDEWFARMETIKTYEEDASAMSRIITWRDGWHHTLEHPFTGAGFEGWRIVTWRDWHSSYVEMFSEHGFIAFGLWMSLILGTLISLTRLPKKVKSVPGMEWVANYCYMLRASLIAYMVGTAFLGLSYWDLLYHLIFISVLVKKFALEELAQKQAATPDKSRHAPRIRSFVRTRQDKPDGLQPS
ncbi:putative O-glycosylation ligase, exosortase A system-associated [Methylomarinovum tepidoasis]|nr:putative O-glycosylation ligase, exosortase A system-associated [Methylomarinovum sp. IN45]